MDAGKYWLRPDRERSRRLQLPGAELLDTVRSKRALVVAGAAMVAISAIIIAFQPSFPLVFSGLVLQGITGGFLGPAIAAISLGLVGHAALPERLGRNHSPRRETWSRPGLWA
jgi:MFS family permease